MLNPELKKKWVDALRSGEYIQAQEKLTDGVGYCCLGVLCEVAKFPEWNGSRLIWEDEYGRNISETALLEHILERIGLKDDDQQTLIRLNDGMNEVEEAADFSKIADYIEANL